MSGSIARTIGRPVGHGVGLPLTLDAGGGVQPPFAAPQGYEWRQVFWGIQPVYQGTQPVIQLMRAA